MKFSQYDRPYDEFGAWSQLCPPDEWRLLPASAFAGIIPSALLAKTNDVLLLSSDAASSVTFIADILRVEPGASAIDMEPYVLGFDHVASRASGYFIHHGDWQGRTVFPGPAFFTRIEASGIGQHYPYSFIPPGSGGPMSEIRAHSEADLFWRELKAIRAGRRHP